MAGTMTASEKQWQAEDDARTLMRAEEIKNDPKRRKAALAVLKKQQQYIATIRK